MVLFFLSTIQFNFPDLTRKLQGLIFFFLFFPSLLFSQTTNIDSLEQILKTEINTETRTNTLIAISEAYEYVNPAKERKYIDKAIEVAKGNEHLEIKAYRKLGSNLSRNNQLDSTMSVTQILLPYYQKNDDKDGIAFCYTLMGHTMKKKYDFEASANFYKKGLKLSENHPLNKTLLHLSLSSVQENLGHQRAALENCFSALRIAEQLKEYKLIGRAKNRIGTLYYTQGDYQRAIEYYKEAMEIFRKGGVDLGIAIANINLANVYFVLEDTKEALRIYEEVLAFSEKINYPPYILYAKCYLSNFYAEANSDKCEPLLTELDTMVSQMDAAGRMQYYMAKIYFYKNQKKYQSAIEFADSLQAFAIVCQDIDRQINSLRLLADLNQEIGNYEPVYDYLIQYKNLSDTLANQERITELKLKEVQYSFDKEQLALKEKYQVEAAAQRKFNIGAILFGMVLIISSFFLFKIAQSRKKLSNELLEKNKDLAVLNESKIRFFSNVSHELKTPLTLIINPLQKLKKGKTLTEDDLYLVKTAEKNSLELLDLTNQILELTKFEMDKVEMNYSSLHFYHFLKKTFADFEPLAKSRGIEFQLNYQGDKNLIIKTDEYKLQTILKNLISNALKFTVSDDFVKIKATEKEGTLEIQVYDSGHGIHAHDLPYVFDRYFQSKIPRAISEGGTGIGLAICKEYSKLFGGDTLVQSKYGESTTFSVSFPKVVAEKTVYVSAQTSTPKLIENEKLIATAFNQDLSTLLLVEDNLEMQEYIRFTLQPHYNIIIANNGYEGMKTLEAQLDKIQLIISDVMMPVMDGYEFLEKVKKEERFAAIPMIMLTALSDTKHKLKGLRIGIDDYLTKPFVDEELSIRIDNLLANADEKKAFQLTAISTAVITSNEEMINEQFTAQADEKTSMEDLEWLENLEVVVMENISDSSYTVDKLARQTAMSRSLIYQKIKALTGLTPNKYINQIRYEQARQYLETKQFSNIKTIAYQFGFKDEKYFSRSFKKRFGKSPSEYVE